jgi:hypothetical protein
VPIAAGDDGRDAGGHRRRLGGRRVAPLPPEVRSYLQPGYREHLAGKIELSDEHDRSVELPDPNCLIVIEKV